MTYHRFLDAFTCILLAFAFWEVWIWDWVVASVIFIVLYRILLAINEIDNERPDRIDDNYVSRFFLYGTLFLLAVAFKFISGFESGNYTIAYIAFIADFLWLLTVGEYIAWWTQTRYLHMTEITT